MIFAPKSLIRYQIIWIVTEINQHFPMPVAEPVSSIARLVISHTFYTGIRIHSLAETGIATLDEHCIGAQSAGRCRFCRHQDVPGPWLLRVWQPDLEQVDFWLAAGDSYNSPIPKDPQHYPANLVD
jgi:hypothetical protein